MYSRKTNGFREQDTDIRSLNVVRLQNARKILILRQLVNRTQGASAPLNLLRGGIVMERRTELLNCTKKHLLEVAKDLQVVGRHGMNKATLVEAIIVKDAQFDTEQNNASLNNVTNGISSTQLSFEEAVEKRMKERRERNPAKDRYEDSAEIGMLVAFYVGDRMYSGKIIEIHANKFRIETKRGVKYLVDKKAVAWYKTGQRWPRGIFEELTKGRVVNEARL